MTQESHVWVYIQRNENRTQNYICTHFHCIVIHNSHNMETTYVPINRYEWIKMWYIWCRIHNGILLSHEKEWHPAICENRDGPSVKCAREKFHITYMWIKKKKRVEKWLTGAREWRNRERFIKGYKGHSLPVQWLGSMLSLS